jgi:energy-converting hydrogenase A subunit E
VNAVFALGLAILVIGVLSVAFVRPKTYVARLINLEIPAWGLLLVMLAYDEALALLTFVAVTAISTFVIVRLMEWRDASC